MRRRAGLCSSSRPGTCQRGQDRWQTAGLRVSEAPHTSCNARPGHGVRPTHAADCPYLGRQPRGADLLAQAVQGAHEADEVGHGACRRSQRSSSLVSAAARGGRVPLPPSPRALQPLCLRRSADAGNAQLGAAHHSAACRRPGSRRRGAPPPAGRGRSPAGAGARRRPPAPRLQPARERRGSISGWGPSQTGVCCLGHAW